MSGAGVLVVHGRGRAGAAALAEGARLARAGQLELTVLAFAPQDTDPAVCGVYTEAFNEGVRAQALDELAEARRLLGEDGTSARYVLLDGRDGALESWAGAEGFAIILLARSGALGLRGRRRAGRLRRVGSEVRLLGPESSPG